jgi:chromosome segregation ATPase
LCLHKRKDVIQTLHGEVNKLMEELTSANISIGQLTAEGQSKQEKLDKLAKVYGEVKSDLKTSNFTVQNLTRSLNDTKVSLNDTIQAKCVVDEKLAVTSRDLNDDAHNVPSRRK